MKKSGRTRRALLVGALAIGGAVVFSAAVPHATADGPVEVNQPYGVLRLRITAGERTITFDPAPGVNATPAPQTISVNNKCGTSTNGSLMVITSTGGNQGVGLEGTNLGVRSKNNCATDSGRINGPETLTLALNNGTFPAGVVVTSAELDIEGKKNADLAYVLDPGTPGGGTTGTVELGHATSDNGPDSGIGDNDRALVPGPFRTIRLAPQGSGAEISLNGGGDGTFGQYETAGLLGEVGTSLETADSIFVLSTVKEFADDLDCGESLDAAEIGTGLVATAAEVKRYDNAGSQPCDDIGATFENRPEGVLLDKSLVGLISGAHQDTVALVQIEWEPQPAAVPLDPREINFTPGDDSAWEDVQWCSDVDWGAAEPTDITPELSALPDITHPSETPWCLVFEQVVPVGDGMVQQTQVYHGAGDPMWR